MRKHLFLYITLIICAGLLSFFFISVYITHSNNVNVARNTVIEKTLILADLFNYSDLDAFVQAGGNTRITVIASDGSILADSRPIDTQIQENRLDRPEIQAAANNTPEVFIRYSDTIGTDMVYYALRVAVGDEHVFVRAAIPVAQIAGYLYQILPLLIILLLIIIVICLFSVRSVANRIIRPFSYVEENLRQLSDGKYTSGSLAGSYEEIDKITKSINDIALVLQNSFNALRDEKDKLSYILNNIGDGLFIVDENANITLANSTALDIFGVSLNIIDKKLNYLTNDNALTESVEDCVNSAKGSLFEFMLDGKIYLVTIKRLMNTGLTMVVISDVTESRESAKRKEEFFSNASHELKTPLTAIKGFNELAVINNNDESLNKYIDGISPTEQMRIFERFYRVEKSRSVINGGTGLGLAIVKHICSLYGWSLSLKSKLGVGTDVVVSF